MMESEFFTEIHVRVTIVSFGEEGERVAFPDESHAEPEDAEAVFDFVAGADGPDQAGYD